MQKLFAMLVFCRRSHSGNATGSEARSDKSHMMIQPLVASFLLGGSSHFISAGNAIKSARHRKRTCGTAADVGSQPYCILNFVQGASLVPAKSLVCTSHD